MTRTNPEPIDDMVQGPAKVTPLHVLGRPATDDHGKAILGTEAWTKNSILEAMFARGKLGERDSQQALTRLDAGRFYSKLYWLLEPHGRDSTQALNGARSGGSGGLPLSLLQQEASRALASIGSHLGAKDFIILKAVCRDEMLPSEGVRLADCDGETRTFARFRDALDELDGAIRESAKSQFTRFNMLRRDL